MASEKMASKKSESRNALVVADKPSQRESYPIIACDPQEMRDIIESNIGDSALRFSDMERIKVPAAGNIFWTIKDLEEGEKSVKELEVIVIYHHEQRAYWEGEFKGGKEPPNCVSATGKVGVGNPGGTCATCPLAQWGSDPKGGKGQCCRKKLVLYVIQKGSLLPSVLMIPPTSIPNTRKYLISLTSRGLCVYGVRTKLTLTKAKSSGGIDYSMVEIQMAGHLSKDDIASIKNYRALLLPAISSSPTLSEMAASREGFVQPPPEDYSGEYHPEGDQEVEGPATPANSANSPKLEDSPF